MIKLNKKQELAIQYLSDDTTKIVLYGGAMGGGKSFLSAFFTVKKLLEATKAGKDITILACAHTITHLRTVYLVEIRKVIDMLNIQYRRKFKANLNTYTNEVHIKGLRGTIILRPVSYMPSDPEYDYLGGYNATHIVLDEAQKIPEKGYYTLLGRLREKSDTNKFLLTCNPGNCYLKNVFYEPYIKGQLPDEIKFVEAKIHDNSINVSDSYVNTILLMSDQVKRRAMGDWYYLDDGDLLFTSEYVYNVFNTGVTYTSIPDSNSYYLSIDIASSGKDKSVWVVWKGYTIIEIIFKAQTTNTEISTMTEHLVNKYNIKKGNVIFDGDGMGSILDINKKYKAFYNNKNKDECYFKMTQIPFSIADTVNLQMDMESETLRSRLEKELLSIRVTSDNKISSKKEIKKSLGHSPDIIDAIMMRYALDENSTNRYKISVVS